MKHLITILFFLQSFYVFSQVPQRINFQAILRNSNGSLLSNTQVGIQISIVQGTASGPTVYTERFTPSTNGNGLVTLEIGGGTMISGNFANINWANGPFYIKSETDPNGGTNYSLVSTTALLSIPYALYAKTAEKVTNLNLSELDDVQINNPVSGQVLKWNGTSWTPATDNTGGGSTSGDDWGNQTAVSSSPLTGTGTTSSPLTISNNSITTNHIQDQSILPADFSEVNVTQNEVFAFQNGQWQTQHLRELGGIIGTGIAGTIPKFSDVSTLTNSIISESTIGLTIDGNVGIERVHYLLKNFE
ncbi:MAG: hypothetical protein IPJ39_06365 [Saprospiraceae bacterium]|nr:hypothetical protein [Saprospiraceae bacterium]